MTTGTSTGTSADMSRATDIAFDAERHIDAMAPALGLTIAPQHREAVAGFLRIARTMAATIERASFDRDAIEPAPVFTPGERAL